MCFLGIGRYLLMLLMCLMGQPVALGADVTIAVMRSDSLLPFEEVLSGFRKGLQQQNIQAELVSLDQGQDLHHLRVQLDRIRPKAIFCLGTKAVETAAHIKDIPKIASLVTYGNWSRWHHRNDIYGVVLDPAPASQFRIIRQAFTGNRRMGVLYNPAYNQKIVEEAKRAAISMGWNLQSYPVDSIKDIPLVFQRLEGRVDLLWSLYDPVVYRPEAARYILMQALRKRIPVVGFSPQFAKAGAPLALYGDYQEMGNQAATQLAVLLKGGETTLRVSRPKTLRIVVNKKVAAIMDITFSPQFMKGVHHIY